MFLLHISCYYSSFWCWDAWARANFILSWKCQNRLCMRIKYIPVVSSEWTLIDFKKSNNTHSNRSRKYCVCCFASLYPADYHHHQWICKRLEFALKFLHSPKSNMLTDRKKKYRWEKLKNDLEGMTEKHIGTPTQTDQMNNWHNNLFNYWHIKCDSPMKPCPPTWVSEYLRSRRHMCTITTYRYSFCWFFFFERRSETHTHTIRQKYCWIWHFISTEHQLIVLKWPIYRTSTYTIFIHWYRHENERWALG